jgi:hypothetical protein
VRVAVTFCNQHSSPRLAVCALDLDTGERRWLRVSPDFESGAAGATEIDGRLVVACQRSGLVRYGDDLEPEGVLPTPGARNLHSVLFRPDERSVYVTSAHDDTLYRYVLDDEGASVVAHEPVYCADPQRRGEDRYHLNSVAEWRGDLYVSMFGTSAGTSLRDRHDGAVVRVSDGEVVASGLYHPHTVFAHGDDLYVVESQAHAVHRIAGGPSATWTIPGGYPRGIVADTGDRLWVGVSALRRESSSLGTPNAIDSTTPLDFRTRLVEIDTGADTGAPGRTIDLTLLAGEVFDVVPLPAGAAFAPSPDGGLAERVEALEASFRSLRAERRALEEKLAAAPGRRVRHLAGRAVQKLMPVSARRRRFGSANTSAR